MPRQPGPQRQDPSPTARPLPQRDQRQVLRIREPGLKGTTCTGYGPEVTLRVELPDHLEGETGQQLVARAHEVCPYSNATRGNIAVQIVVD